MLSHCGGTLSSLRTLHVRIGISIDHRQSPLPMMVQRFTELARRFPTANDPDVYDKCRKNITSYISEHLWKDLADFTTLDRLLKTGKFDINRQFAGFDHTLLMEMIHKEPKFEDIAQMVKRIVVKKADIDAEARDGRTASHLAVTHIKESPRLVELLIDHGADVNAKCDQGQTPLHHAIMNGQLKAIHVLIDHGANVNVPDKKKMRLLAYVKPIKSKDIQCKLKNKLGLS